ncbi:hypothetical protein JW796_02530 [Candidatus Dojkabacteria bacterium]|nr:hypothetical protein [Candidatus Dojkabacteria bacterium]
MTELLAEKQNIPGTGYGKEGYSTKGYGREEYGAIDSQDILVDTEQSDTYKLQIETDPILKKALILIGPDLYTRERETGAGNKRHDDYHHALNTAVIACQAGFNENKDVLLRCILHDYLSPVHMDNNEEMLDRMRKLDQFCQENRVNSELLVHDLFAIEELDEKASEFMNSLEISAVADFFTCPGEERREEIEFFARSYDQSVIAVKVCEIIEKFISQGVGEHDLIQDEKGIFEDNTGRVNQLRLTPRIQGAVKVLKFYLPILEEIGPPALVVYLKNRSVEQLAPKCYKRVSALINQLGEQHIPQLKPVFNVMVESINVLLEKKCPGTKAVVIEPFLKSIGSTIIKMLKYGRKDYPELGKALSDAKNATEKQEATVALLEMMRDLVRARIIVPERSNNAIGKILVPSANIVLKNTAIYKELGFRKCDLTRREGVQIVMNRKYHPHMASLIGLLREKYTEYNGGYSIGTKDNGYQCIHLAIGYLNGDGQQHVMELQLLTEKMQEHNDSNHGMYKYAPQRVKIEP